MRRQTPTLERGSLDSLTLAPARPRNRGLQRPASRCYPAYVPAPGFATWQRSWEGDGVPQAFAVNVYSGEQITAVEQGAPWIQDLNVLQDGTAVYSYCQETGGAFGVRAVLPDGRVQRVCQWQAGRTTSPWQARFPPMGIP